MNIEYGSVVWYPVPHKTGNIVQIEGSAANHGAVC